MTNFFTGFYSGMSMALMIGYAILIFRYVRFWQTLPSWSMPEIWSPKTSVSIIVPARNESEDIIACLESIVLQNYPFDLFEIIVVDDHSEDDTFEKVNALISKKESFKISLLTSKGQGKKAALEAGINFASGELIATTDADCLVPENWLNLLVSFYEKHNSKFIAAPVNFHNEESLLEKFQSLDYMGMMLITGAGIHGKFGWMSNGANLAYPKAVFEELNGFSGIDQVASGDDMLFMQKVVKKYPGQIGFIKNRKATVHTKAKSTWASFLQQRIRWASKTGAYKQPQLVGTQTFVFLYCAFIFLGFPLAFSGINHVLLSFAGLIIVKYIIDFFFLKRSSSFFNRNELMKAFLIAEWMHTVYIFLTGLSSVFRKKHSWKGRKVR
ncbi:MAG: glycosyltransferase [Bacteroidetes bacterium]|nr:MAG: glycosyltransferase [Bacteroidota bacterium]